LAREIAERRRREQQKQAKVRKIERDNVPDWSL